jgi:hypothetical protein
MDDEGTPRRQGKLMTQKDISIEYGLPTRDILLAVQKLLFPMPVRVLGKRSR